MIDESQKPVTDGYREGWERVFGNQPAEVPVPSDNEKNSDVLRAQRDEYRNEWESSCERESARWHAEQEMRAKYDTLVKAARRTRQFLADHAIDFDPLNKALDALGPF